MPQTNSLQQESNSTLGLSVLGARDSRSVKRGDTKLMEEHMKSLSELADIYDRWATANEATAEEIITSLDSLPKEVKEQHFGRSVSVRDDAHFGLGSEQSPDTTKVTFMHRNFSAHYIEF
jgi:hypothetical protein